MNNNDKKCETCGGAKYLPPPHSIICPDCQQKQPTEDDKIREAFEEEFNKTQFDMIAFKVQCFEGFKAGYKSVIKQSEEEVEELQANIMQTIIEKAKLTIQLSEQQKTIDLLTNDILTIGKMFTELRSKHPYI